MAVLAVLLPAAISPSAGAATTTSPSQRQGFIEALAALPAAAEAVATARTDLRNAQVRHAMARSVERVLRSDYATATDDLHEQILVRTRAELVAQRTQETVDDAARQLYSSGGTVPSLIDVMLTATSEDSLMRSLTTRQYLSTAAGAKVQDGAWAQQQAQFADQSRARAAATWSASGAQWSAAEQDLLSASSGVTAAQATVARSQAHYAKLMDLTSVDHSADYGRIKQCGDWLTKLLSRTGFTGENLREAWAIVMRESGGREDAISSSKDLGLFQINTATWKDQPWFNRKSLLKRKYNAKVGYLLSQGGDSWYSWGLDGHGRPDPGAYVKAGWTPERIVAKIIDPYILWYSLYPCRPAYEKDVWMGLPIDLQAASVPRVDDPGPEPLTAGGGGQGSAQPAPVPSLPASGPPTAIPTGPPPLSPSPEPSSVPSSDPSSMPASPPPSIDSAALPSLDPSPPTG